MLLPNLLLSIAPILSCSSKNTETNTDTSTEHEHTSENTTETSTEYEAISGVYEVSQVTCGGEVVPLSVYALVTFDDQSYLEEWSFTGAECTMTLEGTLSLEDDALTLLDVELSCSDSCEAENIPCHNEPCSSEQVYQYSVDGDELLMSFTQEGDEFSCGPCGDGVESTYLLTWLAEPS